MPGTATTRASRTLVSASARPRAATRCTPRGRAIRRAWASRTASRLRRRSPCPAAVQADERVAPCSRSTSQRRAVELGGKSRQQPGSGRDHRAPPAADQLRHQRDGRRGKLQQRHGDAVDRGARRHARSPVQSYGTIASGATATSTAPFLIQLPGNVPAGRNRLHVDGGDRRGTVTLPFTLETGTRNATTTSLRTSSARRRLATAGWTTVHGGGATTVPWVTYSGFCGQRGLFHPNTMGRIRPDERRCRRRSWSSANVPTRHARFLDVLRDRGRSGFQRARLRWTDRRHRRRDRRAGGPSGAPRGVRDAHANESAPLRRTWASRSTFRAVEIPAISRTCRYGPDRPRG